MDDLRLWLELRQNPDNPDIKESRRERYNRLNGLFKALESKCDKVYIEACNVGKDMERALTELYPGTEWNTNRGTCTISGVSGESTDWLIDLGRLLPK